MKLKQLNTFKLECREFLRNCKIRQSKTCFDQCKWCGNNIPNIVFYKIKTTTVWKNRILLHTSLFYTCILCSYFMHIYSIHSPKLHLQHKLHTSFPLHHVKQIKQQLNNEIYLRRQVAKVGSTFGTIACFWDFSPR